MSDGNARIDGARAEGTSCVDDASGNPSAVLLYGHESYDAATDRLRCMGFEDYETAEVRYLLTRVSLVHLSPYLRFVERCETVPQLGVKTANDLLTLDRRFQASLFKYIGLVEAQLKAQYSHWMSSCCGPFSYADASLFHDAAKHREAMASFEREARIRLRLPKGSEVSLPIDQACEYMTLGTMTKFYANTADNVVANRVAGSFGVTKGDLISWSRTVSNVRNICAHYDSLLVRKQLPTPPLAIRGLDAGGAKPTDPFYAALLVIRLLSETGSRFSDRNLHYADRITGELGEVIDVFAKAHPPLVEELGIPESYRETMERTAALRNERWEP